ncbi:MAG: radical SAM protein [Candidatus Omnitrophica bacterium]|nr:radical SAM protein [Candidatus Omnitrophota bacterium]
MDKVDINSGKALKILLCNIAIGVNPTNFPPAGCTSLMNALLSNGYNNVEFFDIDLKRPSPEYLYEYFASKQFDIVGISAVVSTGYRYAKELSLIIKKASPRTQIILGGNLAAAYKILLKKTKIDICVIGEGETPLLSLVRHYEKYGDITSLNQELHDIKGIAYLDQDENPVFTGHQPVSNTVEQPDYDLLRRFTDINQYILDPLSRRDFAYDPRTYAAHRKGKKLATIFTSKGCINSCTFCHRWVKGYRIIPVDQVIDIMKGLMNKYNVGFFCITDECFGENRQWLNEFIDSIRPLDVLFQIGAARVSLLRHDPAIIKRLREVGLTALYFGMESGSDKMLRIMEKNATAAENLHTASVCAEAGIFTSIQLVIGMPGENERTINETIEFIKAATGGLPYPPLLSINYLQALPGTPTYEFLRHRGFLGQTIDDEERYLLDISDIGANEHKQYINVSEEPPSKVALWQKKIYFSSRVHWFKKNGYPYRDNKLFHEYDSIETNRNGIKKVVYMINFFLFNSKFVSHKTLKRIENIYWFFLLFKERHSLYGFRKSWLITLGILKEEDRTSFKVNGKFPLRQFALEKG